MEKSLRGPALSKAVRDYVKQYILENDLKGGDAEHNAAALLEVLGGAKNPYREIVLLNTGAALVVGGGVAGMNAALELADQGIRVNSVAPGATATEMIDRFAGQEGTEGRKQLESLHPMGRLADAKEIAAAVLYLASDSASFTTGISLPVDGGFLAR